MPSTFTFWLLFFVILFFVIVGIIAAQAWYENNKFSNWDDSLKSRLIRRHVDRVTNETDGD